MIRQARRLGGNQATVKKLTSGVLAGALATALAASLAQTPASAAPPEPDTSGSSAVHREDNRPGPLTRERVALRQAAVEALLDGRASKKPQAGGGSTVVLGKSEDGDVKAVEFPDNQKSDKILTILSEFGDQVDPDYGGTAGPRHNTIPKPDRAVDNATTWEADYGKAYYEELFNGRGESMRSFYRDVSGGRYDVTNTVEGWTRVPFNGSYYGANPREDEGGSWDFIEDTGNSWYADKVAELGSAAAVDEYLAQFDVWDRYDFDEDGNFNESDGYIDHFQAVHAGEGEEAGASPDAIWSHRWYVNGTDYGKTGPTVDGRPVLMGGARIGGSKYWIGDYTVEPENGGLGVFVHEFGHDLELPDFYDTAGGDNGSAFWTIMASGSWLGHGAAAGDGIGTTPGGMGPDEKLFLGWLNHATVDPGQSGTFTLSPAAATKAPSGSTQAVVVNLPDKTVERPYTTPAAGSYAWWSGRADGLNNTLRTEVPAATKVTVDASAWWDIEAGYDYLYGEYSTDNGTTWVNAGAPIDGTSRRWKAVSWSYEPQNEPSLFRFRYQTDGGVNLPGAFLDEITVAADGVDLFTDGAENTLAPWTVKGWTRSTGTDVQSVAHYYIVENRQYVGYDKTLQVGPYNFSEAYSRPNWVEFFPYQNGMLVWYADKEYADNNTRAHPGHGQALPVDARPKPFYFEDGTKPGNRRQPFDATFGLEPVDPVCLHKEALVGTGAKAEVKTFTACATERSPIATFDDTNPDAYWSSANPWNSTKVAGHGVTATVNGVTRGQMTVTVTSKAAVSTP